MLKAKLKVTLMANDVLVAESEDETLWRRVLSAMQDGKLPPDEAANLEGKLPSELNADRNSTTPKDSVGKFAAALGVTEPALVGACDPSSEAPFITLDAKSWEAFKKNIPPRGAQSVANVQLAGTLLCLWYMNAGMSSRPTQAQALAVLKTIGATDVNPSRAIKNCSWLQSRADGIQINPAELSKAERVAKAYITKTPLSGAE